MTTEDYINGLPIKEYPGTKRKRVPVPTKKGRTVPLRRIPKETGHGLTWAARWPIIVVVFLVGTCTGGAFGAAGTPTKEHYNQPVIVQPTQAAPPPQVVQLQLPASCTQALAKAQTVFDSAATVANSTDQTLDNLDAAYQAIMHKDGQKMNEAGTAIREQRLKLMKAEVDVMTQYQTIKDGLATCPR